MCYSTMRSAAAVAALWASFCSAQNAPTPPPPNTSDLCPLPLDLIFLFDASSSITKDDWQIDLSVAQAVANNFTFGPKRAAAGVVVFGTVDPCYQSYTDPECCFVGPGGKVGDCGMRVSTPQPLTQDKAQFLATVPTVKQTGGATPTGKGIEAAIAEFKKDGRPDAKKLLITITDGEPNKGGGEAGALNASAALKAMGAEHIIIAVTGTDSDGPINMTILGQMATSPKYVIVAKNWKDLPALIHKTFEPGVCGYKCSTTGYQCVAAPPGEGVPKAQCEKSCTPAPTPAPTPVPTQPTPAPTPAPTPGPPIASQPCIRFGHTFASKEVVTCHIEQTTPSGTGRNYTFGGYSFTQFSEWTSEFVVGTGKVQIFEGNGTGGKLILEVDDIPLTPGPLVVALKCNPVGPCDWPPTGTQLGTNIETIAASFVPVAQGEKVRLFNLAPDVAMASLSAQGNSLATGVKFSLGSDWVDAPANTTKYTAADGNGPSIATVSYTPDPAPNGLGVFTQWLMGSKAKAQTSFGPQLIPYADAPEQGRCNPI